MLKIPLAIMAALCVLMFVWPVDTPSCGGYSDPFNTCRGEGDSK